MAPVVETSGLEKTLVSVLESAFELPATTWTCQTLQNELLPIQSASSAATQRSTLAGWQTIPPALPPPAESEESGVPGD